MKIPEIPQKLENWTSEKLDELIKFVDIESETLDFKKEPNELDQHICSMANTKGGFLILGIGQEKSKDGKKIIRFTKNGFPLGEQETILNEITNSAYNVEPLPKIEFNHLKDDSKFYTVIKIESKDSDKPYFIKSTDQCFVRLHNSKRRANRSVILNLFSEVVEKIKNVERLRASSSLLRDEIMRTTEFIEAIDTKGPTNTAPLDLNFIRNSVLSSETFLQEKSLWSDKDYDSFPFVFNTIELLNSYIHKFNELTNVALRTQIREMLISSGYVYKSNIIQVLKFLEKVIHGCDEYLNKFK